MMTADFARPPVMPFLIAKPLGLLLNGTARLPTERVLNVMFAEQLADGDLDFLSDRVVTVQIDDMDLRFSLTLIENKLRVLRATHDGDVQIAGTAYAFLQLATRTEDTDTLFFRRHLSTTGDTELGLYVKNLLDSIDLTAMPLQPALDKCLRLGLRTADTTDKVRSRVGRLLGKRST
jgi:predicted lipid carrier protein YhbT